MKQTLKHQNDAIMSSLRTLKTAMASELPFENFIVATFESMMKLEREEFLNTVEMESEDKTKSDKANGFYQRVFESFKTHNLRISIPRSRSGVFKPDTLHLIKLSEEERNAFCVELLKKGVSTRDIEDLMKTFFGNNLSPTSISNMTKQFHRLRLAWEQSALEVKYTVIYFDAVYITVKRGNSYTKEAIHIAYGILPNGNRELVSLTCNPSESASNWEEVFISLRKRGVQDVEIFVGDGLPGMEDIIQKTYPKSSFQKCVVHLMRSILLKVRPKDKEELAIDLKRIFNNFTSKATKELALQKVEDFNIKWSKAYPEITKKLANNTQMDYYFTYINFPSEIRRNIYTTNPIENLNKQVRKVTKNKLSFENPVSLLDFVFIVIKEFEEKKWCKYPIQTFKNYELTKEETQ